MKKIIVCFLLPCVYMLPLSLKAQVLPDSTTPKKCTPAIIATMHTIIDKQIQIAAIDKSHDSVAEINENKTVKYKYGVIALVLQIKTLISLSSIQVAVITAQTDTLKTMEDSFIQQNPGQTFYSKPLEYQYLTRVLTDVQFARVVIIKNSVKAHQLAQRDWDELTQRGIAGDYNQQTTTQQIANLYLAREFANTRYKDDDAKRKKYLQYLYNNDEPEAIKKLYDARKNSGDTLGINRFSASSQFLLALKNKITLELSQSEVDSLVAWADTLKNIKISNFTLDSINPFNTRAYESGYLNRLLTDNQYKQLLLMKNSDKANDVAINDWKEMVQCGISVNYNKDTVVQQLFAFYIARDNVYDRYEYDKVKQNTELKYIADSKPQVLIDLIHERRRANNNALVQPTEKTN
jgi:hypothetical protein